MFRKVSKLTPTYNWLLSKMWLLYSQRLSKRSMNNHNCWSPLRLLISYHSGWTFFSPVGPTNTIIGDSSNEKLSGQSNLDLSVITLVEKLSGQLQENSTHVTINTIPDQSTTIKFKRISYNQPDDIIIHI